MRSLSQSRSLRSLTSHVLSHSLTSLSPLTSGFIVNGQAVTEGDTINICRGNSLTYLSTATGNTSTNWQFHLGTPATSIVANPPAIFYNVNGLDSTIQIVSDGVVSDTFFIIVNIIADILYSIIDPRVRIK